MNSIRVLLLVLFLGSVGTERTQVIEPVQEMVNNIVFPEDYFPQEQYEEMAKAVMLAVKWKYEEEEYVLKSEDISKITNISIVQQDGPLTVIFFDLDGKEMMGKYDWLKDRDKDLMVYPETIWDMIEESLFEKCVVDCVTYQCNNWEEASQIIGYAWTVPKIINNKTYEEVLEILGDKEQMDALWSLWY